MHATLTGTKGILNPERLYVLQQASLGDKNRDLSGSYLLLALEFIKSDRRLLDSNAKPRKSRYDGEDKPTSGFDAAVARICRASFYET